MATQLTISLELIAFMQWVIQHKAEAFSNFMDKALDDEIREALAKLQADQSATLSSDELYSTLHNFLGSIEQHLEQSLEQSRHMVTRSSQQKKGQKHQKKQCSHAHHTPNEETAQPTRLHDGSFLPDAHA